MVEIYDPTKDTKPCRKHIRSDGVIRCSYDQCPADHDCRVLKNYECALGLKNNIKYTFDDYSIGLTDNGKFLKEKYVYRPKNIELNDWYNLAGKVVELLNKESNEHR